MALKVNGYDYVTERDNFSWPRCHLKCSRECKKNAFDKKTAFFPNSLFQASETFVKSDSVKRKLNAYEEILHSSSEEKERK